MFEPHVLRRHILNMAYAGQTVHVSCVFSMVEIMSILYSKYLRYNPKDPLDPKRDFLSISKGHAAMAVYACTRELGWITDEDMANYCKDGTALRTLCEANVPPFEATSGSLGHGFPIAAGLALGLKLRKKAQKVFSISGDGELNEGTMWETCLFAGHHRLSNLCLIIDANGFQAMGTTKSIIDLDPLADKFRSFNFEVAECDGHDLKSLDEAMGRLMRVQDKPQVLIAKTVKGKGVSFMENDNCWHYTRLTDDQYRRALKEVEEEGARNHA